MYEGITPIENRDFISSTGDWTGDATWDAGPIKGRVGLLKFTKPVGITDITASLSYPYVKPLPNKRQAITAYLIRQLGISCPYPFWLSITDGIYTYSSWVPPMPPDDTWTALSIDQTFPTDWIVANTVLSIKAQGGADVDLTMWWDHFSLYPITTKLDNLPLMGVH